MRVEMGHFPMAPQEELEGVTFGDETQLWYASQYQAIATESEFERLNEEWLSNAGDIHDGQDELQQHLIQAIEQVAWQPRLADMDGWPL